MDQMNPSADNVKPQKRLWLLTVWNVPVPLLGLMAGLKLQPTMKNPNNFWRHCRTRTEISGVIAPLSAAGLHGQAKRVNAT
jgi:hypothetical protein